MRSVVDRNVVMWRIPVCSLHHQAVWKNKVEAFTLGWLEIKKTLQIFLY